MKKLLVMLLAITMVLSMTFALASCGGDDAGDASSKNDSKTESKAESTDSAAASEETSDVASDETSDVASEETSDASEETSDDSSDETTDGSSEDASKDDDSSAATAPDYKTNANKTNYALGKTYTLTRDTTDTDPAILYLGHSSGNLSFSDADLTKMTDGIVGDITDAEYTDPNKVAKTGISVCLQGTDKLFEYIIDLGDYYGDIKNITFRQVRDGRAYGANRGFKVRLAYVSDDGTTWTKVSGEAEYVDIPGAPELKSNLDENVLGVQHFDINYKLDAAAQGKYVRVILVSNGGYVIQLEEIEIWNQ